MKMEINGMIEDQLRWMGIHSAWKEIDGNGGFKMIICYISGIVWHSKEIC